jgi:citrate lyase subunit beta/citryl-CoA lyase
VKIGARALRSLLFVPANQPALFPKAARTAADAVILDLEDAVPDQEKHAARRVLEKEGVAFVREFPDTSVFVRVNSMAGPWFEADLRAVPSTAAGVVIPKVESREELEAARRQVGPGHEVVAGIETVKGVVHADAILCPAAFGAYFGAEDYITDLGGRRTRGGEEVLYARSRVALAARLHGLASFDQIVVDFSDASRFRDDAERGRALGYGGKLCIHPSQVPLTNDVFAVDVDERSWAERLLRAHDEAVRDGIGAFPFEGQMVDRPMIQRARQLIGRSDGA